ncbi:MAG: AraC family transcriptional regulator N-terminal domain-containing protein, partial [Acidobacteria bacterium]|nr:AraC family transcriptional regulator N-terminal domain-containing protein [Acidobacteriota bacterium]
MPGVHAIRRSSVSRDMVRATVAPALCVVAQGAKVVVLGREVFAYDTSRMIAYSVEL